jgi:tRNA(Ile)-lysidine synthase TilS/MesJ
MLFFKDDMKNFSNAEKKLLRKMRQAINDFQMIKPKEKVIVGISG